VGPDPRSRLPADFFDQEPIVAMLAGYEFGPFFLTVRGLAHWTQQTFGGVIGLEQSEISEPVGKRVRPPVRLVWVREWDVGGPNGGMAGRRW